MALHYCKKCGRVVEIKPDKTGHIDDTCDYCKSKVFPVPEKYWLDGLDFLITNEQKNLLREELVKTAPEFDEYLFNHRDNDLHQQWAKTEAALDHGKSVLEEQARTPKCPSCGSSNVSKIGVVGRAVSFKLVGFASSKIGKTHKCNNCGTMW